MLLDERCETFLAVAREGGLSAAARSLMLSTVSVKRQVDVLESQVGVRLLVRGHRGTGLTEAGRLLAEDVVRLRALADEAVSRAREAGGRDRRAIRVGTSIMRPCRPLVDILTRARPPLPFSIEVVPFSDDPESLEGVVGHLGTGAVDCFVGPCGSHHYLDVCNVLVLGSWDCCVAVARDDRLAEKPRLGWEDLDGRRLMLVRRGDSFSLDRLRDDIEQSHPGITVVDAPHFYDPEVFNACGRDGLVMETLDAWADVHPNVVTLSMDWDYQVPFGILYAKEPSERVAAFIDAVARTSA